MKWLTPNRAFWLLLVLAMVAMTGMHYTRNNVVSTCDKPEPKKDCVVNPVYPFGSPIKEFCY